MLDRADENPRWLQPRDTPGLLRLACEDGWFDRARCDALVSAHATLLDVGLKCTLDRRPRITPETDAIADARAVIRAATQEAGLAFG